MKKGFTVIELIVTMAILATLLGFIYINSLRPQSSTALQGATEVLVSDLRAQQLKSMTGDNGAIEASPSGIIFNTTSYVLFTGEQTYTVNLPNNVSFSAINFPQAKITFATGSGEIVGFNPSTSDVTLKWSDFQTKQIMLNRYGSVSEIN